MMKGWHLIFGIPPLILGDGTVSLYPTFFFLLKNPFAAHAQTNEYPNENLVWNFLEFLQK